MDWYESWFNEQYLALYPHRSREEANRQVKFLLDGPLADEAQQRLQLLDIACGNGRHLVEFIKNGFDAVGIDLSAALLRAAKTLLETELDSIDSSTIIQQADMRSLPFADSTFDVLTNFFTSFGYFESDDEQLNALIEWRRVGKKSCKLVMDYLNRDFVIDTLRADDEKETQHWVFKQHRSITADGLRVEKRINILNKKTNESSVHIESVRMFSKIELESLLKHAGFSPQAAYAGFTAKSFDKDSPRLLLISENKKGNSSGE